MRDKAYSSRRTEDVPEGLREPGCTEGRTVSREIGSDVSEGAENAQVRDLAGEVHVWSGQDHVDRAEHRDEIYAGRLAVCWIASARFTTDMWRRDALRAPEANRATAAAWDRRWRSGRVRMTPASTTPAFSGTGTPAGVVKGFDQIAPAALEPVAASRERLHLVRAPPAKHQGPVARRPDFDR